MFFKTTMAGGFSRVYYFVVLRSISPAYTFAESYYFNPQTSSNKAKQAQFGQSTAYICFFFSLKHTFLITQSFQDHVTLLLRTHFLFYMYFLKIDILQWLITNFPTSARNSKHTHWPYATLHCWGGGSFSSIVCFAPFWLFLSYSQVCLWDYKYGRSPFETV